MQGLRRLGAVTGPQRHRGVFVVFEPEAVKRVLDALCAEAGVEVLLHAFVSGADRGEDGRIVDRFLAGPCGRAHRAGPRLRRCQRRGRSRLLRRGVDALRQRRAGEPRHARHALRRHLQGRHGRHGRISSPQAVARGARTVHQGPQRDHAPADIGRPRLLRRLRADYDPRDARSFSERRAARPRSRPGPISRSMRSHAGLRRTPTSPRPVPSSARANRGTSRRSIGSAWQDVVAGPRACDDAIALGAWGIEWHDRKTFAEHASSIRRTRGPIEIPLRCLVSRDTANLFAAGRRRRRRPDRPAPALRVMGTAFATGQAAGVAAALVAERGEARCLCGAGCPASPGRPDRSDLVFAGTAPLRGAHDHEMSARGVARSQP